MFENFRQLHQETNIWPRLLCNFFPILCAFQERRIGLEVVQEKHLNLWQSHLLMMKEDRRWWDS